MSTAETFAGFEERYEPGIGRAVGLAVAVHLVLLGMLFVGVRWHSQPPAAVMVELWQPAPPVTVAKYCVTWPRPRIRIKGRERPCHV